MPGWRASPKEPDWSEAELKILERNAHKTPEAIMGLLHRRGYSRSLTGIVLKRKRMRFLDNLDGQSASDLALCFGVANKTVLNWIEKGYLKAGKRGTARTAAQGGDIWWIKEKAIREFIVSYTSVIDFRKIDKFWLVSLLAA